MGFKSITLEELEALVKEMKAFYPPETLVTFASDYGDHCHTRQVHRLKGVFEEVVIRESAYSDSGYAVNERADEDDQEDESRHAGKALLIS